MSAMSTTTAKTDVLEESEEISSGPKLLPSGSDIQQEAKPSDLSKTETVYIKPRQRRWRRFASKRSTLLWSKFIIVLAIFLTNLVLTLVAWLTFETSNDGVITFFRGSCDHAKRLDTALHFIINVLSTLLLNLSDSALQLAVAPTRAEVDRAHSEGKWLDIGVPSLRNLRFMPKSSRLLWTLFWISSVPVHFL
jgi:hypothetical protein